MVGEQIEIVAQQGLQALLLHAGNAAVLVFPEITVVDQHRIGLFHQCRIQQRLTGGHPGDNAANLLAALDLQAVRAVIPEIVRSQDGFQCLHHCIDICRHSALRY